MGDKVQQLRSESQEWPQRKNRHVAVISSEGREGGGVTCLDRACHLCGSRLCKTQEAGSTRTKEQITEWRGCAQPSLTFFTLACSALASFSAFLASFSSCFAVNCARATIAKSDRPSPPSVPYALHPSPLWFPASAREDSQLWLCSGLQEGDPASGVRGPSVLPRPSHGAGRRLRGQH